MGHKVMNPEDINVIVAASRLVGISIKEILFSNDTQDSFSLGVGSESHTLSIIPAVSRTGKPTGLLTTHTFWA